jgi:hypothetical protein
MARAVLELVWTSLGCVIMLFKLAQVEDASLLWRAKTINQDTFSLLDVQYLAGAGVARTIQYLSSLADEEVLPVIEIDKKAYTAVDYLEACVSAGDFHPDILACTQGRIEELEENYILTA